MPLKIEFKTGDKLMINGAVIENIGTNAKILLHNEASILRNKEVLSEAEGLTPASRVYMALQCAYMFPDQKESYEQAFEQYLTDYVSACPSAKDIATEIRDQVASDRLYKALKTTQGLIRHEAGVLQQFHADVSHMVEETEADALSDDNADSPADADKD